MDKTWETVQQKSKSPHSAMEEKKEKRGKTNTHRHAGTSDAFCQEKWSRGWLLSQTLLRRPITRPQMMSRLDYEPLAGTFCFIFSVVLGFCYSTLVSLYVLTDQLNRIELVVSFPLLPLRSLIFSLTPQPLQNGKRLYAVSFSLHYHPIRGTELYV